jgi:predicted aspartyl protease
VRAAFDEEDVNVNMRFRRISGANPGLILLSLTLFFVPPFLACAQQSELSQQSGNHQMFWLRDEVARNPASPDFYTGEVACAFNDVVTCQEKFKKVTSVASSPTAKNAHHILAYALLREGRFARALHELDALLAIDPKDSDANDTRPFFEVLSHFPDQTVPKNSASKATVHLHDGEVPLLINGKKAFYFIDTGANLSTLTESEALRLGMEIKGVNATGGSTDINGNRVLFRVARAQSIALGGIVLNNVAFLVTSNDQPPFVDMKTGERGLIGLPVVIALESVKWTRKGTFEVDRSPKRTDVAAANLCFDDLSLIVEASFDQHALPFALDTGATTTELWAKFADVAAELIRKFGSRESHTVTGLGGSQKFDAASIPKVTLLLGGKPVTLQPAHILAAEQKSEAKWLYGNLGMDLLNQAQTVAIDFRTMTLALDPGPPHTN